MFSIFRTLFFVSHVYGHMALFHPSAYGFDGDDYNVATPLSGLPFHEWWFHGNLQSKPIGEPMLIPAGGSFSVELSCNKRFTSYGDAGDGSTACPDDIGSYHAGNPIRNPDILGCGVAVAYKDNAASVTPSDFTIFSVNTDCVRDLHTSFDVPKEMPECPNGKCICAWFWQGQTSFDEMYMTGFECIITGSASSTRIGSPRVPIYCPDGSCVSGPKQPMYWANEHPNIEFDGVYTHKPSYNLAWGFTNGAQNDIFIGQQSPPTSNSSSNTTTLPTGSLGKHTPTCVPSAVSCSTLRDCIYSH